MKIKVATDGILRHKADCLVVGVPKTGAKPTGELAQLDSASGDMVAKLLRHRDLFKSQLLHTVLMAKGDYKLLLLVACGKKELLSFDLQRLFAKVGAKCIKVAAKSVVVHLPSLTGGDEAWSVRQAAQALAASTYDFKLGLRLATKGPAQITLLVDGKCKPAEHARALRIGEGIGTGMRLAKHLSEQPPNVLYPATLAQATSSFARAAGLNVNVLLLKDLVRLRMGGILGVGQASERTPRLIVLRHDGGRKGTAPVALVGKGVTFDTGGNSLKPGSAMVDMKFDMAGAAGVIGAMIAIAHMRLPLNVVAVMPSVENMVAGNAYRPDDVLRMMDGSLVEVLNTDAEGRLILADALTYTQKFHNPAAIVDCATLTGACLIALGQHRAGMCATTDELADALSAAAEDSADPCWRLPLDDAYDKLLKSKIADFANIGGGRMAGTITAACFLKRFVKVKQWAHLDIAGTAWQDRRASGRPVPALATWLVRRAGWIKD